MQETNDQRERREATVRKEKGWSKGEEEDSLGKCEKKRK